MSEENPRPRVVFDCMIYLQATVNESGPAAALLRLVDNDEVALFVSREVLGEVRNVLSRPRIRQRNRAITDERVDALLGRVTEKATLLDNVRPHFTYARDPKDEKYINLAIEVAATYLVSRDNDLLDLMTGMTGESQDFQRRFSSLTVIDPVEFLRTVRPRASREPVDEEPD
jgi:putative PIN family toxin of toxin-antitoxin system